MCACEFPRRNDRGILRPAAAPMARRKHSPAPSTRRGWLRPVFPARRSRRNRKWEIRPSSAPRQHLAHLCDKLVSLHRNLCRTILYPLGAAIDVLRKFAAESEILQLHFAFRPFVTAFDDGDGGPSPVGIFELIAELLVAGIGFGAD